MELILLITGLLKLSIITNDSDANIESIFSVDLHSTYLTDADSPNMPLGTEPLDAFGFSLAKGDFNQDGHDDFAIGVPGNNFNVGVNDTGAVVVVYGKYSGVPDTAVSLTQTLIADQDGLEAGDFFGWSLATGDFDGDGYDDLAVGTPFEDVTLDFNDPGNSTFTDAGAINIFYGSSQGLSTDSDYIHADTDVAFGGSQVQDSSEFGLALASGDFNNDGRDELVVGVHRHDIYTNSVDYIAEAGSVFVYNGHSLGIRGWDRTIINQLDSGIFGVAEPDDRFGFSLAVGNFNGDDYDDLAVGVPYEDYEGHLDAGVVQLIYGTSNGLPHSGGIWAQDDLTGLQVEANDFFGFSLATGDLNGDSYDELVVGSPYEDLGTIVDAGVFHAIYGSAVGLTDAGNITVFQGDGSIFGTAETGDVFGLVLTTEDFDLDGYDDVVIGTPFEDTAGNSAGIVHMVFGSATGMDINDSLYYIENQAEANFGGSLIAGDFGSGQSLIIGVPGKESNDMDFQAGAINTKIYQNPYLIFKNGFELNL